MSEVKEIKTKGTGLVKVELADRHALFGAKINGKMLKIHDSASYTFKPGISRTTGMLLTGVTEEECRAFEDKLGYEKGYLSINSKFWHSFKIKVPAIGVILDLNDPMSYFKYKVLCADELVAKSIEELKANHYCELTMINEEDKTQVLLNKRSYIIKAMSLVANFTSIEYRDAYLYIKGFEPKNVNETIIRNTVESYAENNPKEFVDKFSSSDYKDKLLFTRLISSGIITKQGMGFDSPLRYKDVSLGNNLESAMLFLRQPKNNSIFVEIMSENNKINANKSIIEAAPNKSLTELASEIEETKPKAKK